MPRLTPIALSCLAFARAALATIVDLNPTIDTFLRSAAPDANYGSGGSLSISGSTATNGSGVQQGLFDSLMQFDLGAFKTQLDGEFGAGGWTIDGVSLKLTEQAAPGGTIFNRGQGQFEVRWIANDNWLEGDGTPNVPTTDGITWNGKNGLLDAQTDATLGTFANAGSNSLQTFLLSLNSAAFTGDIIGGGLVSLYFTAASPTIGFTFNSKNFGTQSAWPILEVSAVAVPEPRILGLLAVAGVALTRRRRLHPAA